MTETKKIKNNQKVEVVEKPEVMKRKLKGVVVANKMAKTIVVKVERMKLNQKYQKRYKVSKKYKVHDEANKCKVGDTVEFVECRPLSKDKRWRIAYSQK